jgi:peptide/nickel transport system substrate-binding protein
MVEFSLLGPVQVRAGGAALPLGGRKQRALLALLLLSPNEPLSRDRLIDGLWGGDPPPAATASLDSHLSRVRRVLGPGRIERRPAGYAIVVGPDELDVRRFRQMVLAARDTPRPADRARMLRSALALWRGQALADVLFEPFAQSASRELEEERLAVLEERVDADLEAGGGAALVGELEGLVREHPLRERLVGLLMLALYRAGRQAQALAAMQAARRRLAEELGLEPSPSLRELERRILRHDPALGGPSPAPPAATTSRRRRSRPVAALAVAGVLAVCAAPVVSGFDGGTAHAVVRPVRLASSPAAMVQAAGSLWIAVPDDQAVLRVDPASGHVADRIPVAGEPGSLAAADGAVWAASTLGQGLDRIDPATGRITQHVPLHAATISGIAAFAGKIWVAQTSEASVAVIDAGTGRVEAVHDLEFRPTALATSGGAIWAAATDGNAVAEIDPSSGTVITTVHVGNGPVALAATPDGLWVTNGLDATVSRIDPRTATVVSTIPVGGMPSALAGAGDTMWVADQSSPRITRIDTRTNRVTGVRGLTNVAGALAASADGIWAAGEAAPASHRGGTLTIVSTQPLPTIDPSLQFTAEPLQFGRLAYDSLVTFEVAPGPSGLHLVPDLAETLPAPTDGGTRYTFRLRPGIRYSDGRPLRAGDFRRGMQRLFRLHSLGASYFSDIRGATSCRRSPSACTFAAGIKPDDALGTVTFRLARPDPDFLFKLAVMSYGAPVPPGTPWHRVDDQAVPGTGPYHIVGSLPSVRFVRNPFFREWSHAAQPAGYPDVIAWRVDRSFAAVARAVEDGRADWLFGLLSPAQAHRLRVREPAQIHMNPAPIFDFIPLNTHLRPFDDVRVRQALNAAIDRRRIARMYGPGVAEPWCHSLLAGMPGFRPFCPYRGAGGTHTDLAEARRLVAASGTRGEVVDVWGPTDELGVPRQIPAYVASVLRTLGYRTRLHLHPLAWYTEERRRHLQLTVDGDWLADWPSPSAYLPQFLGCDGGYSNGYVCDQRLDGQMHRASALTLRDPERSAQLWARADRTITRDALWVPTVNVRAVELASRRLRQYEYHPVWGFIADQAWLR